MGYVQQGKLYVRGDSKIFRFQNGKSESLFLQRKNPRKISWTVLYRRQHKKGISEVSRPHARLPTSKPARTRTPPTTIRPEAIRHRPPPLLGLRKETTTNYEKNSD